MTGSLKPVLAFYAAVHMVSFAKPHISLAPLP